ncbi:MAG: CYTH domain-containing protein [Clostridiales Family XIII bacterium]|jgi:triphosphatase|nr:CYTH domain-containing protein [Clostridiales Family XIII bacterium]
MEVELKYRIENKRQMDLIWEDDFLRSMEERDSRESIYMKAAYFDTADFILRKNRIAFRIRKEGDKVMATLKWRDRDVDVRGLYMREEINVPVKDEACFLSPDPAIFKESGEGRDLMEILADDPLRCIFETHFYRKKLRIDSGETICEVSLDEGEVIADAGRALISELEIELFSGKQDDLIRIGERMAEKYDLKPEPLSKYAKGINLTAGEEQA